MHIAPGCRPTQTTCSPNATTAPTNCCSARFQHFDHSFRSRWAYSNYGIFLGQYTAARAAGMSPPQLLSSTMLVPLGMTRSGPVQAELFRDDNRATAHNIDGSIMPYENVDRFSGAGAIVSTGRDIGRWMTMLLGQGTFEGKPIGGAAKNLDWFMLQFQDSPGIRAD
ncbi:serine hydrolase [Paraburkholderia sediminicola]|uniref:serine hydrolase domain-containing protein n=1 Tax=Paraburkholderia sediminicola TaxID=458836 RepID=UPI0038B988D7